MFFFKKRFLIWSVTLLLLLSAFLRLDRIRDYATFLGDEGRDALVVKRMIVDGKPTLLGPSTSIGDLFLGPAYYYMMIPGLWLANLDPVGPAVTVALIGVATVWLVWRVGRDFFGPKAGWTASILYAISQPIIEHTRFSWNPNPMPFFALLAVWGVVRAKETKKGWWLAVVGACLGISLQLHYLALGLVAGVVVLVLALRPRVSWWWYLAGAGAGLVMISPMILFDLRHDFLISQGLIRFISQDNKLGMSLVVLAQRIVSNWWRLHTYFLAAGITWLGVLILVFELFWLRRIVEGKQGGVGAKTLMIWFFVGLVVAGFYTGDVHDHYLGFLFPAPFLLVGAWFEKRSWLRFFGRMLVLVLLVVNVARLDRVTGRSPNYQIERARVVGEAIAQDVEPGEAFNLALISPTRDFRAMNYRYFAEIYNQPAEGFENYDQIDTLYVIIEGEDSRPVGVTAWEIDTFHPKTLVDEWRFDFGYQVEKYQKTQGAE